MPKDEADSRAPATAEAKERAESGAARRLRRAPAAAPADNAAGASRDSARRLAEPSLERRCAAPADVQRHQPMQAAAAARQARHRPRPQRGVARDDDAASSAPRAIRRRRSRCNTTVARISSRWACCRSRSRRSRVASRTRSPACASRPIRAIECGAREREARRDEPAPSARRCAPAGRLPILGGMRGRLPPPLPPQRRRRCDEDSDEGLMLAYAAGHAAVVRHALRAAQGRRVSLHPAPLPRCRRGRRALPGRVDERDPRARELCAHRQVHDVDLHARAQQGGGPLARRTGRRSSRRSTTTRTARRAPSSSRSPGSALDEPETRASSQRARRAPARARSTRCPRSSAMHSCCNTKADCRSRRSPRPPAWARRR